MKNWLIVVLLAVNLISISVIWMLAGREGNETPPAQTKERRGDSSRLLKEVLGLSAEQMKKLEKLNAQKPDLMKRYNDSLAALKKTIAEDLYSESRDTARVAEKAKAVGELQSRIEVLRYQHFNDLLALCTAEQKEKLKPILLEVFGRKPPKEEMRPEKREEKGRMERRERNDEKPEPPDKPRDDKPRPPDIDEKIAKYTGRLNLSQEQQTQLRDILAVSREKGEKLRALKNPDREMIEREKEKIRQDEDQAVMNMLNDRQKAEFEKMLNKRRK